MKNTLKRRWIGTFVLIFSSSLILFLFGSIVESNFVIFYWCQGSRIIIGGAWATVMLVSIFISTIDSMNNYR